MAALGEAWMPGAVLASGDKSGHVMVWDPDTGKQRGKTLLGHKQWVTSLAWEPLHLGDGTSRRLASASKVQKSPPRRYTLPPCS